MKTIGIIGGTSDVATGEYYRLINAGIKARLGGYHTAEMIINSMDFGEVERLVTGNLWQEGETYVHRHAKALDRGKYFYESGLWPATVLCNLGLLPRSSGVTCPAISHRCSGEEYAEINGQQPVSTSSFVSQTLGTEPIS